MVKVVRRWYQFASSRYADAFVPTKPVETSALRSRAVALVRAQKREWWEDPVRSISCGEGVSVKSATIPTIDAFGNENGLSSLSTFEEAKEMCERAMNVNVKDARDVVRVAEAALFDPEGPFAPRLVANQALDFKKQDGVTEIEESLQASVVERKMNDDLIKDEAGGVVEIDRTLAVVCAVQNFSHFLDLSRKVLRNIELGIPVVVLSRSSSGQHVYRWVEAARDAIREACSRRGDAEAAEKLVSFVNCDLEVQKRLFTEVFRDSPVYLTGSREAAVAVKELARRCFASCGGPNTMILSADAALDLEAFASAARHSAFIENSGQCTALRHVVAPGAHMADVENRLLDDRPTMACVDALETGEFSALLSESPTLSEARSTEKGYGSLGQELASEGYSISKAEKSAFHASSRDRVAWRVNTALPTPSSSQWQLKEYWRKVVLDVTSPASKAALTDDRNVSKLASWIIAAQPISVVVNKDSATDPETLAFARNLWERTAQVVFGVGDVIKPALTAQARPQEGEVFGEVPPRYQLDSHTAAVVCVPSSTPSYAASYSPDYLMSIADDDANLPPAARAVVAACKDPLTRGFCVEISRYLADAARGPRRGVDESMRDVLWGLQRPPLGPEGSTWLRLSSHDSLDAAAPAIVAFACTNAASQLRVSVHPANPEIDTVSAVIGHGILDDLSRRGTDAQFNADVVTAKPWNVLRAADYDCGARYGKQFQYSLASHFVTRLFPIGHVKSTRQNDQSFRSIFESSPKWLRAHGSQASL